MVQTIGERHASAVVAGYIGRAHGALDVSLGRCIRAPGGR